MLIGIYEILREGRGSHFDPIILDKFFEMRSEIEETQENYKHEEPFSIEAHEAIG